MNFTIFKKLMALPLSSAERAVTTAIVYRVQKDGNSSFPSYATICKESGVSNSTLSKVVKTLRCVGLLDWRHRANVLTGKESNEYIFTFEGIKFNRDNLSKAQFVDIKAQLKKSRNRVTAEMKAQTKANKRPSTYQDNGNDTSINWSAGKSQSSSIGVRAITGSEGSTISPHIGVIPPHIGAEVVKDSVPLTNACTNRNSSDTNEGQSQKRLDKVKSNNKTTSTQSQDVDYLPKQVSQNKSPQEQTHDEWLADFDRVKR